MSGIFETIQADIAAIKAKLDALSGMQSAAVVQQQPYVAPVQTTAQVAQFDPLTGQPIQGAAAAVPAQAASPANLTADQITALIQPHLGNDAIKGELGNAMRSMGINALPETQPHQYGQLYSLFQGVIARFTGGHAAAPAQQPPAQAASII